ncbi:MAG: T9SS type A sorting domain-containing protein [Bacteroidia bacterium]
MQIRKKYVGLGKIIKNMPLRLFFIFILFPIIGFTQSVTVGTGNFIGSVYGPMYSTNAFDTAFSRHAYIYPSSVLSGLIHGDTIGSIEFYAQADLAMTGNPNLKIYLRMVKNDTFPTSNLNWTNESKSSGMVLVYDANPISIMDGTSGFKNFIFNVNKFRFDTTGGKVNLEILLAYNQTTKQQSNTLWAYESNITVPSFKSKNEGKLIYGSGQFKDTTAYSDVRKPYIRINFPRYKKNLELMMTYCLGKVPVLANVKDSIKVLIGNRGKNEVSSATLYLEISGANKHKDSIAIGKLKPWEDKLIVFGSYKPDSSGTDNVKVSLSADDFNSNNYDTIIRQVNYNVFSHTDPFKGNAGGIGFNGETGDFVAKFFSDTGVYINQVSVDFSSNGRGFRVGIWDDNGTGGMPGSILFMSDSLTSKGGTYILPVLPRVKVNGGFFVGIRQNTRTNVGFSFQYEDPIRPGAFYFTAPMGNTTWTPFSPGFPYKFNIQPRIQVGNDVAPLTIEYPTNNQDIEYSIKDSLGPRATVTNYGFNDQNTPFEVECIIANAFGTTEYKSTKKLTLKAGQTDTIYFDTTYRLYNLGNHKITVTTKLGNDKVIDNNTIEHQFKVSVKNDIGCDFMYSPVDAAIYEYKRDTMTPTVRIVNFGTIAKNNFKVTFRIKNDTSIIHSETLTRSLAALQQQIITFNKYVPKTVGNYVAECFTSLKDSIPYNDTIRHTVTFQKSNDVAPKRIDIPLATGIYTMAGFFFPRLTIVNYGSKTQDTAFKVEVSIYDTKGQQFFQDSINTPLGAYSETQLIFKRANLPNVFGKYKLIFKTALIGDQEPDNDTLTGFFTVIPNRDIGVQKMMLPALDTVVSIESLPFKPIVRIKNYGSQTLTAAGPAYVKIYRGGNLVYQDSAFATGNLSYNSSFNITLNKNFTNTALGDYTLKMYTGLSGDLIAANDTLYSKFRITRNYDLALDSNTNFGNGQVFLYEKSDLKPQILVKNFGSKSYPETYEVKLDLYKNGGLFKSMVRYFDSLPRFATNSWFQDTLASLRQVGNFKLCARVKGALDQNNGNDSFCWKYFIIKPNDLALDSIIFPDKNNSCYHNITYQPRLKATNLGTAAIVNSPIELRIYQTTNIYWLSSKTVSLAPSESKWIKFDSTLGFDFTGVAWARAVGYLANDNEKANDTLIRVFNVAMKSAVNTISKSGFKIYPNPTSGKLFMDVPNNSKQQLTIWNTSGQKVFEQILKPSDNKMELNLKNELGFYSGIYFIRLQNSETNQLFKLVVY